MGNGVKQAIAIQDGFMVFTNEPFCVKGKTYEYVIRFNRIYVHDERALSHEMTLSFFLQYFKDINGKYDKYFLEEELFDI
jgi:hypothetical protein